MSSDPVGYYAENTTGITSGCPYHTSRDCRTLQRSNQDNIIELTEDQINRHRLRECTVCQRTQTAAVLKSLDLTEE